MQIGEFGTIINLVLLGATYLILQPLKAQMAALGESLNANSEAISKLREILSAESRNVAKLDESVRSAHKRIDELHEQVEELTKRCIECNCRT